ncbi:hypothetical protein AJ80_04205 [Polytolypa hystricis UAMH7299]|uniref:PNPLA domain-containing protein n=1 Tax=Polytolypa hystricis (strain UAMH7299) TaxID=1447883 RepID=A0A2B7YET9_POLH7|nr:hypothetical protein AJ80_04205 [Polytolypa hystricis UAMH7299]
MATIIGLFSFLSSLLFVLLDVAQFWKPKLLAWLRSKPRRVVLRQRLEAAQTFQEWEQAAIELDEFLNADLWRQNPVNNDYDHRLISTRLRNLRRAQEGDDPGTAATLLRSGLLRDLANITSPRLYGHALAGTKHLIEDYVAQLAICIRFITASPTIPRHPSDFDSQDKLDFLRDTRQAFGRTTLVLEGGAMFGICHLGVIKALHQKGLLPRIITGTATGAIIAALIGIHTEQELLPFLDGEGIDLSAAGRPRGPRGSIFSLLRREPGYGWLRTLRRRLQRYIRENYLQDLKVMEECVRGYVGDMTFEEAYAKTNRVLNITLAISGRAGIPALLNYLTAPNVLIWSAAMASNLSSVARGTTIMYCKDETGAIVPWPNFDRITLRPWRQLNYGFRQSPLDRLGELFNVNHFIVSQARPFFIPLLRVDIPRPGQSHGHRWRITRPFMRLVELEIRYRLRQLDFFGLLPIPLRRIVIDEEMPTASITIIPDLSLWDLTKAFKSPTRQDLRNWILKGERGVWPNIVSLKNRCTVELELERGYQIVKRKPQPGMLDVFDY